MSPGPPAGLRSTTLFLRGFFDRWSIKPTFFAREEFKNFANMFTQKSYTGAHKEATVSLLSNMADQVMQEKGLGTGARIGGAESGKV